MEIVKATLPCGEILAFDVDEWGLSATEDTAWFIEPLPRCARCAFPDKEKYEGEIICKAVIEFIDEPESMA